jgi:hypothetical protein
LGNQDIELISVLSKQRKQQIVKKLNKIFQKVYEDDEFCDKYSVFSVSFRMVRVDCNDGFCYNYLQILESKQI